MRHNNFGRKKRQLKVLVEKLHHLVRYHRKEADAQMEKLIQKIRSLVDELTGVLSRSTLKKILGVAAVVTGISFSNDANAQSFAVPVVNPFGLDSVFSTAFPANADLDGDGDLDLLVGEGYGVMQYFQNTGSESDPQFAAPVANPFGLVSTYYWAIPAFADLDGDGDQDLLVGEYYGEMQYFQNIGEKFDIQFAAPIENPFGLVSTYYISAPTFADLDGDGDLDLLVGEENGAIQYFQNTGSVSNPQFAAPIANPFGLASTYYWAIPTMADVDKDGDLDLLVGELGGSMQYFKNIGSALTPKFDLPLTNPFGLVSTYKTAFPAFADLDDDGDEDLLVGEYGGAIQYFKNDTIVGIADVAQAFKLKVFPNPVKNILHIDAEEEISKIEIFNIAGEKVTTVEHQVDQVPLNHLSPGIYMVKVSSASGNFSTAKIQKQ